MSDFFTDCYLADEPKFWLCHSSNRQPTNLVDFFSDPIGGVRKAVTNFQKEVAGRSHEMTETLKPFLGKVFHAVSNSGAIYRYRFVVLCHLN